MDVQSQTKHFDMGLFKKMEKVLAQSHQVTMSYLLLATVDLPFLLSRKAKHGLSVFLREIQLIL